MLIYFIIAIVGTVFLLVSGILGEVFDFFGAGDVDVDGGGSFFSGKVIAVALTAFGAAGMLTSYYDVEPLLGAIISALAAMALGGAAAWLIEKLYQSTASTDVTLTSFVGRQGRLTVGIAANSLGEVQLAAASSTRHFPARSRDGSAIRAGAAVRVVESFGSAFVVEPIDGVPTVPVETLEPSPANPPSAT